VSCKVHGALQVAVTSIITISSSIIIILYYAKRQHKHYKCSIQSIKP